MQDEFCFLENRMQKMKNLTTVTLLAVYLEVVTPLAIITVQNDPTKSPVHSYLAPGRQFSLPARNPTMSRQGSTSSYNLGLIQLQPFNFLTRILLSPFQNFDGYMTSGIYALSNLFNYQKHANVTPSARIQKPVIAINVNKQLKIPTKLNSINSMKSHPKTTIGNFKGSLFSNSFGQLINTGNSSASEPSINAKISADIPVQQPGKTVTVEGKNGKIYVNDELKYADDKSFKNDHQVRILFLAGNFYVNNNMVMKKGRSDHDRVIESIHDLYHTGVTHFVLKLQSNGSLEYKDNKSRYLNVNYYTPIVSMKSLSNLL